MDDKDIIALLKREVVPAVGCTEPAAVALCCAYAAEALGTKPRKVEVKLSANMLKNAMGVGIPGTGMTGLPVAIAIGTLWGRSADGLEVLKGTDAQRLAAAKEFIAEGRISIKLCEDCCDTLYIQVRCTDGDLHSEAIIAREHRLLVFREGPCCETFDIRASLGGSNTQQEESADGLSLRRVFEFATTAPLEDLEFINESAKLNEAAAEESLRGNYGHELGKTLSRPLGKGILGDSIFSHIICATSSACDARMAGAPVPVMSNSGSGNQGIAATLPVVVFARENHNTEEELTRALVLSHLTAIYIKQSLGRLSCLCGCVVASTGSSCGITYLMGGGYEQVSASVKNMIANLAGMVCDGAKPSCALKVSSGVSTAVLSAILAIQNHSVTSAEGLIEDDVDRTIHNMTRLGSLGMRETDRMVLDIMTHKQKGTNQ